MSSLSNLQKMLPISIVLIVASFSLPSYAQNAASSTNQTQMLEQQIQSLQQPGGATPASAQQAATSAQQQAQSAAQAATDNANSTLKALQQAQVVGPNQGQNPLQQTGSGQNLGNAAQVLAGTATGAAPTAQTAQNPGQPGATNAPPTNSLPSLVPPTQQVTPAQLTPTAPTVPPPVPQAGMDQNAAPAAAQLPSTQQVGAVPNPAETAIRSMSPQDLNDAAFTATMQNVLPMTPDQIQKLRSLYNASQYAAASSPDAPPRPTATSLFVDLSPGATPPVIRLSQGFVSSLVFIDSSGAPWPIESYDVGNPTAFNIQWDKTSNTLMVQSQTLYNYGNLAVKLRGLNTPIMLTLIPGQKAVDYRVDLRVQGYGPNASALPVGNGLPNSADPTLLNILDGIPPDGSKILTVSGPEVQAWLSGTTMYVRTRMDVISPGWISTMSSADGMHAYQMQPTPILLITENGKVVQLKIEGF